MSSTYTKVVKAKTTFATLRENISQSDYITRKKGLQTFCNNRNICNKLTVAPNYSTINSFNWGKYVMDVNNCQNIIPINKSSLIIGQYSRFNLDNACTIIAGQPPLYPGYPCPSIPVTVNPTIPFYSEYTIDPKGALFGYSQCGELNYTQYLQFTPNKKFNVYNRIT